MENWKTAGWVPDSDDEDGDFLALPNSGPRDASAQRTPVGSQQVAEDGGSESDEDELALPAPLPSKRELAKVATSKTSPVIFSSDAVRENIGEEAWADKSQAGQPGYVLPGSQGYAAKEDGAIHDGQSMDWHGNDSPKQPGLRIEIPPRPAEEPSERIRTTSPTARDSQMQEILVNKNNSQDLSLLDSPLSSISSLSGDIPADFLLDIERVPNPEIVEEVTARPTLEFDDSEHLARIYGGSRSLRQRNPIQLHPYLLEMEHYKQSMHSRGVKALKIRQETQGGSEEEEAGSDDNGDDTQAFQPDSQDFDTRSQHGTQGLEAVSEHFGRLSDEDPELPDVNDLLNSASRRLSRPKKRKRPPAENQARRMRPPKPLGHQNLHTVDALPTPGKSDEVESPRSSVPRKPAPLRPTNGFRLPPTARNLHADHDESSPATPSVPNRILSPPSSPGIISASRPRRRPVAISDESDNTPTKDDSSDTESEPDSSPTTAQDRQAALFQKRIRGVLPASWTSINLQQAQERRNTQNQRQLASEQHRGVAKPIKPRPANPVTYERSSHAPLVVFSDDEEDTPPGANRAIPAVALDVPDAEDPLHIVWPDSDDMEDNAVDMMLTGGGGKKNRIKQSRNKSYIREQDQSGRHLRQTKIFDRLGQSKKKQSQPKLRTRRPRRMGILDVDQRLQEMPDFIRVAARQAKRQPHKGRSSPSRKVFRMHQAEDQRDVQTTLKTWRNDLRTESEDEEEEEVEGDFAGLSSGQQSRAPLMPISPNKSYRQEPHRKSVPDGSNHRQTSPKQPTARKRSSTKRQPRNAKSMQEALFKYANQKATIVGSMKSQGVKKTTLMRGNGAGVLGSLGGTYPTGPAQLSTAKVVEDEPTNIRFAPMRPLAGQVADVAGPGQLHEFVGIHEQLRESPPPPEYLPRKPRRKRPPRQRRLQLFPSESLSEDEVQTSNTATSKPSLPDSVLKGLERHDFTCSLNFGIEPLPNASFFSRRSYLGSGRFSRCLYMQEDEVTVVEELPTVSASWGVWNETVRSELASCMEGIKSHIADLVRRTEDRGAATSQASCSVTQLEGIADYLRYRIRFADPVDCKDFLESCLVMVQGVLECLQDVYGSYLGEGNDLQSSSKNLFCTASRLAVITHQLDSLSKHDTVPQEIRKQCRNTLRDAIKQSLALITEPDLNNLRRFLRAHSSIGLEMTAIGEDLSSVAESIVIVAHVARQHTVDFDGFWKHWEKTSLLSSQSISDDPMKTGVGMLESKWRDLYSILPLLDLSELGTKSSDPALSNDWSNWPLVERLLTPVFKGYQLGATGALPSFNRYCRTVLVRCFDLLSRWQWQRCDSIIVFLFKFFGKNRLANLKGERVQGPPAFLEHLRDDQALKVEDNDTCFQVFLKIVGNGIKATRKSAAEKKAINLVGRLIPNHDRRHPKDQEIRQEDLDTTSNHHDLLCTLFWAAPPSQRPDLKYLRNLVEDEGSHREAYHINIRAWSILTRFQIRSDSTQAALQPFHDWVANLTDRLLQQHTLARTEVDAEANRAEAAGGLTIDQRTREKAIESNQKQIESLLRDLLSTLATAIDCCPSADAARKLIPVSLSRVLGLQDPSKQLRADKTVTSALRVIKAVVDADARRSEQGQSQNSSQKDVDSQGFDWSGFADIEEDLTLMPAFPPVLLEVLESPMYDAVHDLLLACFNDSRPRSEDLLKSLIEIWAQIATHYVKSGHRSWDNYLGHYGRDTWGVVADSAKKRKHSPYLLTLLLQGSSDAFDKEPQAFLEGWLCSLVDREAQLRYQGDLTAQMLQVAHSNALLANLPVAGDARGRYHVTLDMILQRRLAVLTAVFSNMRVSVSLENCPNNAIRSEMVTDYQHLLRQVMLAMKARFEELGEENDKQGAYVRFVHQVLRSLQEHVQEICPLDPFFTNPAVFPPPDGDPAYISSKLRAYGLRLSDPRTPKQLVTFLLAITEREVYDGKQSEMTQHLVRTMTGMDGASCKSALRSLVLRKLLPEMAHSVSGKLAGYPLLMPVAAAATQVLEDVERNLDGFCEEGVETATECVEGVLVSLLNVSSFCLAANPSSRGPVELCAHALSTTARVLPLLDYLMNLDRVARSDSLYQAVVVAIKFSHNLRTWLWNTQEPVWKFDRIRQTRKTPEDSAFKEFMQREIRRSLQRFRHEEEQDVFKVVRGTRWKTVEPTADMETLKRRLKDAVLEFDSEVQRLPCMEEIAETVTVQMMMADMTL